MFKKAEFQHLGFATPDIAATVKFYTEDLGFEIINECTTEDGTVPIVFVRNGAMTYEFYEDKTLSPEMAKKIDHISYDSKDIEADYAKAIADGYTITTNGIEGNRKVFDRGVRYFKIAGPSGEQVEFCQIL